VNRTETRYLDLLQHTLFNGQPHQDRTGVGTRRVFSNTFRAPCQELGLMRSKFVWPKGVITELCWFLRGDTNIGYLQDHGVHFWDEWADEDGELGPVYGEQLRGRGDQWATLIQRVKEQPHSRRNLMTTWHPERLDEMRLPPCHGLVIQAHVSRGLLSLSVTQRSGDIFLGVPFNILSYQLMCMVLARATGLEPGTVYLTVNDLHLYDNHVEQATEQVQRGNNLKANRSAWAPAGITLASSLDPYNPKPEDFVVHGYNVYRGHLGKLKAEVAV